MERKSPQCPCKNKPLFICFYKNCPSPYLCNFGCRKSHDPLHDGCYIVPITDLQSKHFFTNCIENFDSTEEELERCQSQIKLKLNEFMETIQNHFLEFMKQTKEKISNINLKGSRKHSMRKDDYLQKLIRLQTLRSEILKKPCFQTESSDIEDIRKQASESINSFLTQTNQLMKVKIKVDNRMEDISKSLEPYFEKSLKNVSIFVEKFKGLIDNIEAFVNSKDFISQNIITSPLKDSHLLKFPENNSKSYEQVNIWFEKIHIESKFLDKSYSGYVRSFAFDNLNDLLFKAHKSDENMILLEIINVRKRKLIQKIKVGNSNNTYPLCINYIPEYKQILISDYHLKDLIVYKSSGGPYKFNTRVSLESNKLACIFPIVNYNLLVLGYNFEIGKILFLNLNDFSKHHEILSHHCNSVKEYKGNLIFTVGKYSINLINLASIENFRTFAMTSNSYDIWCFDILESSELFCCGSSDVKGRVNIYKIQEESQIFLQLITSVTINHNEVYSCFFISHNHILVSADDANIYLVESRDGNYSLKSKKLTILNKIWFMEYNKSINAIAVRNGFKGVNIIR